MRLPDFLQFTPDERRAALALLLLTGGGGLILEIGKRHPEWAPDLLAAARGRKAVVGPAGKLAEADSGTIVAAFVTGTAGQSTRADSGRSLDPSPDGTTAVAPVQPAPPGGNSGEDNPRPARTGQGRAAKKKADPAHPVPVNVADVNELMTLPGIGPALAQRIVDERARNGPFQSPGDLTRVKGIGKATLARLTPLITTGRRPEG